MKDVSKKINIRKGKKLLLAIIDIVILILSWLVTSKVVANTDLSLKSLELYPVVGVSIICLICMGFYKIKIEASSLDLLIKGFVGLFISSMICTIGLSLLYSFAPVLKFLFVFYTTSTLAIIGYRICYRIAITYNSKLQSNNNNPKAIVYGAGEIGQQLARMHFKNKLNYNIIGFIDDDESKYHTLVNGIKVLDNYEHIDSILETIKPDYFIIAISGLAGDKISKVMDITSTRNIKTLIIPSMFEVYKGKKTYADLRDINYEDLLGRELNKIDEQPILEMVKGKRVLVTGAGGSIGSEICTQLVSYSPDKLFLLDIDETELHNLSLRLHDYKTEFSSSIFPICCDIKNAKKIDRIIKEYKPDIIFHAAAYKHVPMMEYYPEEAITNNIKGSYNVLSTAVKYKVSRCVVISTDKAVNPTNVMGATKRAVELIATSLANDTTEMVCVRFGNVIGSRGSMLPLFLEQIQNNVPITVTHKEMIRYFMAIPEAVSLVFLAATLAKSGEVMVLDMGHPVNIYEFAQKLVKYFGNSKSRIVVTGLRPGEKLYEELLADEDTTIPTDHPKVKKAKIVTNKADLKTLEDLVNKLDDLNPEELVEELCNLIPEFTNKKDRKIDAR